MKQPKFVLIAALLCMLFIISTFPVSAAEVSAQKRELESKQAQQNEILIKTRQSMIKSKQQIAAFKLSVEKLKDLKTSLLPEYEKMKADMLAYLKSFDDSSDFIHAQKNLKNWFEKMKESFKPNAQDPVFKRLIRDCNDQIDVINKTMDILNKAREKGMIALQQMTKNQVQIIALLKMDQAKQAVEHFKKVANGLVEVISNFEKELPTPKKPTTPSN